MFGMYFLYLLKILLHQSTSKFGSEVHISLRFVFREIRSHISMSNIFYHSMYYRKYYLVMESIIPISYHNLWIVLWGYFQYYWSYITRSSYCIFGYLHDFYQCMHWFYPITHLGFNPPLIVEGFITFIIIYLDEKLFRVMAEI